MKTKDVEITWEDKPAIVKIKRLNFGELNDVAESSVKIIFRGETPEVIPSQKQMKEQALLKCIVEAPFTINIQNIQKLDPEDGLKLFQEFNVLHQKSFPVGSKSVM